MKQKLFLGALLLGALTFNSCVDDTESASVTAVRQAKVEQLKSIAALNDAQAQAELITANATKAAQEARAEYYKAQAAYQQAMAEYQNARTETEKANAQAAIAEAEYNKQKWANELQLLAGQLEMQLLQQKTQMLQAQTAYEQAVQNNDQVMKNKLTKLFTNYKNAQSTLFDAQKTLAQYEIELARAKAGLTSGTEQLEFLISQENNSIKGWEEDNLVKQAYIDTWEKYTKGEAQEAIDKAYQEKLALDVKAKEATQNVIAAKNAKNIAENALEKSPYAEAVEEVKTGKAGDYVKVKAIVDNLDNPAVHEAYANAPKEARDKYCAVITKTVGSSTTATEYTYIPLFSLEVSEKKNLEYTLTGINSVDTYKDDIEYEVYTAYYDLVAGGIEEYIAAVEETQKEFSDKYKAADKKYKDAVKAEADAKKAYDDAVAADEKAKAATKAVAEAEAAEAAARVLAEKADATAAQKKAYIDAQEATKKAKDAETKALGESTKAGDPEAKLNAYKDAQAETVVALQALNTAELNLTQSNELIADLKANAKILNDGAAANTTNMQALNKENLAVANAEKDEKLAKNAADVKNAEYLALTDRVQLDSNNQPIESTINSYKSEIKNNNNQIAQAKKTIAEYQKQIENGKVNVEMAIKNTENDIAKQKAQIEVYQKEYDLAKAALDEAMKADAPAE